jgi:hypothetical protein
MGNASAVSNAVAVSSGASMLPVEGIFLCATIAAPIMIAWRERNRGAIYAITGFTVLAGSATRCQRTSQESTLADGWIC